MAETRRSLADILTLFADNAGGDISAQDARDMIFSVFAGGLEPNNQTITTADVTGAVGQLYVCTIAGLTANRNLTLPSATVGERIGVYVADGDATYALIVKGAASQTINGGSAATDSETGGPRKPDEHHRLQASLSPCPETVPPFRLFRLTIPQTCNLLSAHSTIRRFLNRTRCTLEPGESSPRTDDCFPPCPCRVHERKRQRL